MSRTDAASAAVADKHASHARSLGDEAAQLGEALRQPLLGAAIRGAWRNTTKGCAGSEADRRAAALRARVPRRIEHRCRARRAGRLQCPAPSPAPGSTPPDARRVGGRLIARVKQPAAQIARESPIARECALAPPATPRETNSAAAAPRRTRPPRAIARCAATSTRRHVPPPLERDHVVDAGDHRKERRDAARAPPRRCASPAKRDCGCRQAAAAPSRHRPASSARARRAAEASCTMAPVHRYPSRSCILAPSSVAASHLSHRRTHYSAFAGNMPVASAPAHRASGDASTATAPDAVARTSRARRCSAA